MATGSSWMHRSQGLLLLLPFEHAQQRATLILSVGCRCCRDLQLMVKAINNANQPSCQRAAVQAVSCIAGVQGSNRRGAVKAGALQVRPAGLAAARWCAWGLPQGFLSKGGRLCSPGCVPT